MITKALKIFRTKRLRGWSAVAILAVFALCILNFKPQDSSFISIIGKVNYLRNEYPDLRAKIYITEDGKPFKTIKADNKGRFETKVNINHNYVFNLSMEYHATSKVSVNTKMPAEFTEGNVGGIFEFDCDIFELFEEVNYSILKKPLLKIKFDQNKKEFRFDEQYTNNMLYDLDGFREQIAEMKQRRKEAITQAEKEAQKSIAKSEPPKEKKAKAIVFESEKKKPEKKNTSGHRNILDGFDEEQDEEVAVVEEVVNEFEEADSLLEESEAVALSKDVAPEEMETEDIFLEEELDASAYMTLNIKPKKTKIEEKVEAEVEIDEEVVDMDYTKMKVQQMLELTRLEEEAKIREEVKSFNYLTYVQKEKRLSNKKVQNEFLRIMIKTIALAEIYYKQEHYRKYPIEHVHLDPIVSTYSTESWWVDTKTVTISYPSVTTRYRTEVYPFGITYYYRGDEEIDEDTYCREMNELSKKSAVCGV